MKQKISIFLLLCTVIITGVSAQSRNPLNNIPADVKICSSTSPMYLKENIIYKADGTKHQRSFYEYNEDGLLSSYTDQYWDSSTNQWGIQQKYIYNYNSENVRIEEIFLTYGAQGWKNHTKKNLIRKDGVLAEELNYLWDSQNEDWMVAANSKTLYTYNEEGHIIEFYDQFYDASSGNWKAPHSKMTYKRNAAGQVTEEVLQYWDNEKQEWANRLKDTFEYDAETHKTNIFVYDWKNDKWEEHSKQILSYDDEGKLTRAEYYTSFDDSSLDAYNIYTYSNSFLSEETSLTNIESEVITAYPNPAISYINIKIPETFINKSAYLYDTAGKLVKTIYLDNEITRVNISGLTNGIYIVKIENQTIKIVKR